MVGTFILVLIICGLLLAAMFCVSACAVSSQISREDEEE